MTDRAEKQRGYVRRYLRSEKGKTKKRAYNKTAAAKARTRERVRKWRLRNRGKWQAIKDRYLNSEKGRRMLELKHSMRLPVGAPSDLVQSIRLLRTIRQEMKS